MRRIERPRLLTHHHHSYPETVDDDDHIIVGNRIRSFLRKRYTRPPFFLLTMPPPPVTYFVVGKAGDEEFAKAENLAESLMSALPAVTCHIHPTLPDAWPALCKTTCAR